MCRIAVAKNLLAVTWFDAPDVVQLRAFRDHSRAMQSPSTGRTAMINLICDGTPRFSGAVRDELTALMGEHLHMLGAAHVVLVDGLRGAAVRAFLATAMLVGRATAPAKVYGTIPPAIAQLESWLAPSGTRWTRDELAEVIDRATKRRAPSRALD